VAPARYTDNGGEERQMIETLAAGSWTAADVPVPPDGKAGSGATFQTAGSCSADLCIVPGYYETTGGESSVMFAMLIDGQWSASKAPTQIVGGGHNFLAAGSLSCSSNDTCVVIGTYGGVVDTYSEGTWSATQLPVPRGGVAGSADVGDSGEPACSSNGLCVVGARYTDASGEELEMLDTLDGGTWRSIRIPVPSGGEKDTGYLPFSLVACSSSVEVCVVPGFYVDAEGQGRRMLVVGKGAP
jgi:hypothetical protein